MNATPVTKTHNIQEKLIPYLNANEELSEVEYKLCEKEANSILDYVERNETLGLLYAVQKKDALMEQHFENALSFSFNLTTLSNYSSILNRRALFNKRRNILCKYKKDLNTPDLLQHFLEVASIYLDSNIAEFICKKAIEIKCKDFYLNAFNLLKKQILEIRKLTNCSDTQIELISDICSKILRKYNQSPSAFSLKTIAGENYVIVVNINDIEILFDMNDELANRVSETDELNSCKLIAVFRSTKILIYECIRR